jgi:hypothetical protein
VGLSAQIRTTDRTGKDQTPRHKKSRPTQENQISSNLLASVRGPEIALLSKPILLRYALISPFWVRLTMRLPKVKMIWTTEVRGLPRL